MDGEYIREYWSEIWNPDNRVWQYVDRILFPLLPLLSVILLIIPERYKVIMTNLVWVIPLSLWVLFLVLIVPYRLTSKYNRKWKEATQRVVELEEERIPKIIAVPITGNRARYEAVRYTAWAELKITNTSSSMPLNDVSVKIMELTQVLEKQDGRGSYFLHEPYPSWNPSNVYWSERNAQPKQLTLAISPNESKCALIAFHGELSPDLGIFNTPTYPVMLESKIVIEVSSPNSETRRGVYYIEYHPPTRDEFEFVEWDSWRESHNVIEQSTLGKGDSQT